MICSSLFTPHKLPDQIWPVPNRTFPEQSLDFLGEESMGLSTGMQRGVPPPHEPAPCPCFM